MRKIIVTGGSGKAGRLVVRELVEHGYQVMNLDLAPPARLQPLESQQKSVYHHPLPAHLRRRLGSSLSRAGRKASTTTLSSSSATP